MRSNAARATSAKVAPEKLLSIGQVLTKLKAEFPDLAPSKLRYLEEQGIVSPQRTASGYRKFSTTDVDRLRFALSLQRDQYLPLRVIKEQLDELDDGVGEGFRRYIQPVEQLRRPVGKLTHESLAAEAGCAPKFVRECVSAGLLPRTPNLPSDALRIVQSAYSLQEFGIEPRHLRVIRSMVERESDIIEQVVESSGGRRTAAATAKSEKSATDILSLFATIHDAMIGIELSQHRVK